MWTIRLFTIFALLCLTSVYSLNPADAGNLKSKSLCSTNAECMKIGQPLLKPTRRYSRNRALRPRQSNVPPMYTGAIQILDANSNSLGYVSRTLNQANIYDVTTDLNNALVVSFGQSDNGPVLFTISPGTRNAAYPYFGGAFNGGATTANMGGTGSSASRSYASFVGAASEVRGKAQNTPTTFQPRGNQGVETDVFFYNPATTQITAQWTNTDGSVRDTIFYRGQGGYGLGMISPVNFAAFRSSFSSANPQIVTFYLVSPPAS
ncbi:hypothetical protein V866_002414 [Kwoniella sp. B9012]|uniref:Uncharacterized protein n=1 Tax=Kwoniella europaea PYCC6329 TaxID=1423913 RepID=A0AAX4KE33_9TREE